MIKKDDEFSVEIFKQDHLGNGIGKILDKIVFVKNAVVGDRVIIKIAEVRKKYLKGSIVTFLEKSKMRRKSPCPYSNKCGGCHLINIEYPYQLAFKQKKVEEILSKYASVNENLINDILPSFEFLYRNKVIFHKNDKKLGLFMEKTNDIISIDNCMLVNPYISEIYKKIYEYVTNTNLDIKSIMFKISESSREIMLVIDGSVDDKFINFVGELGIKTFILNDKVIFGDGYITEKINDMYFLISPKSFFQINYGNMCKMYNLVINYVKDKNYNKVLDLYCGTGTIGMLVSPYVKEVIGVEVVEDAIKDALKNKEINNVSNINFLLGKVEDKINFFKDIDLVIVDPPRSGLDDITIKTIMNIKPKDIIYVSCDPMTLARDLKILQEDYDVLEVTPIDMFPNTYHVESVTVLHQKSYYKRKEGENE